MVTISGSHATLRQNLFEMTQDEESTWRRPYLLQVASNHEATDRRISFQGASLCLKGFAIIVGGQNYLRVCYRDLASLAVDDDLGMIPRADKAQMLRSLQSQSHRARVLRTYLEELVDQLAESCPVTGKKIISVSHYRTRKFVSR
jgi:hypothetical protein